MVVGVVEHDRLAAEDQQVPAVRRGQHVRIEDEAGRAVGDDPAVDGRHLLEALRGAGEVVRRRDDRLAAAGLGLEEVHELLLRRRVDAGHGLVEQVEVGVRGERPGEEHAPPLAARQLTDLHAAVLGHPDLLEGLVTARSSGPGRRSGPSAG